VDQAAHWREAIAKNHEDYARYVREGHGRDVSVRQLGALEKLELALEKLTEAVRVEASA
jgi:hypothetical protein